MTAIPPDQLDKMHAYWRAANYLSVGQIYLKDNPLLDRAAVHRRHQARLLGHWGTTPGLNFIYTHLNRLITEHDLDMIYVMGPGHGGPGWWPTPISKAHTARSIRISAREADGLQRLFRQFSLPCGIPSHVAPETPGSIHEGGDWATLCSTPTARPSTIPDLIVACVVGDGEAETGPCATSWHSNKFLNPARDGAVLPILHLNGYKIANPTVLARIPQDELESLFAGYGYDAVLPRGRRSGAHAPADGGHPRRHARRDPGIQRPGTQRQSRRRPRWPMFVLRTPKGWTGPKVVDGKPVEGTWRSHQVPLSELRTNPDHLRALEGWMKSYRPDQLFDADGEA